MKLYLCGLLATVVVVLFAYCMGKQTGIQRCVARYTDSVVQQQSKIIEIQRGIDAETVSRATDDIRGFLRQKYTIAE